MYNVYILWNIYCILRVIHGSYCTMVFFKTIFGKSYEIIYYFFSYIYEKIQKKKDEIKYLIEENDDFLLITLD